MIIVIKNLEIDQKEREKMKKIQQILTIINIKNSGINQKKRTVEDNISN